MYTRKRMKTSAPTLRHRRSRRRRNQRRRRDGTGPSSRFWSARIASSRRRKRSWRRWKVRPNLERKGVNVFFIVRLRFDNGACNINKKYKNQRNQIISEHINTFLEIALLISQRNFLRVFYVFLVLLSSWGSNVACLESISDYHESVIALLNHVFFVFSAYRGV